MTMKNKVTIAPPSQMKHEYILLNKEIAPSTNYKDGDDDKNVVAKATSMKEALKQHYGY